MRKCFRNIWMIVLLFVITLPAFAERQFETIDLGGGKSLSYGYHLPTDFDPEQTYPVLIGPGEVDAESKSGFFWRKNMPEKLDWILIETMSFFEGDAVKNTTKFLDHLQSRFKVEGGRFHVVCFSANSSPIFGVVLAIPERFQSATGIPGHPSTTDKNVLRALKNTRTQFIVGENDGYWRAASEKAHKILTELEYDSIIDIIPNGGHILRDLIGEGFLKKMERMRGKGEKGSSKS